MATEGRNALLKHPPWEVMEAYYDSVKRSGIGGSLAVRLTEHMGKGVFAERSFSEGEVVLREPMLVGLQHTANKGVALVCSHCLKFVGPLELQVGRRLLSVIDNESVQQDCEDSSVPSTDSEDDLSDAELNRTDKGVAGDDVNSAELVEIVSALLDGKARVPFAEKFPLPHLVECKGKCDEDVYCSEECSNIAWENYHRLLCTGPLSEASNVSAMEEFNHHADETNDIFRLVAKVISSTLLRARKVKAESANGEADYLNNAWLPFAVGHKEKWWDISLSHEDIEEVKGEMKSLAKESLHFLREAIFDEGCTPLFSLEVYSNIIGMFELNNLAVVVPSPIRHYFDFIDQLEVKEKEKIEHVVGLVKSALGETYGYPCEGTAFYAIQSCVNHSCDPNLKAFKSDNDMDGSAVLIATRYIPEGEQVFISYIDETQLVDKRREELEEYGFSCKCIKCYE